MTSAAFDAKKASASTYCFGVAQIGSTTAVRWKRSSCCTVEARRWARFGARFASSAAISATHAELLSDYSVGMTSRNYNKYNPSLILGTLNAGGNSKEASQQSAAMLQQLYTRQLSNTMGDIVSHPAQGTKALFTFITSYHKDGSFGSIHIPIHNPI